MDITTLIKGSSISGHLKASDIEKIVFSKFIEECCLIV